MSVEPITIKAKYYASVREVIGRKDEVLQLPSEISVADLLHFYEKYDEKVRSFLFDEQGNLREEFTFLINGEALDRSEFASRRIMDGDEIVILPPVGGG